MNNLYISSDDFAITAFQCDTDLNNQNGSHIPRTAKICQSQLKITKTNSISTIKFHNLTKEIFLLLALGHIGDDFMKFSSKNDKI